MFLSDTYIHSVSILPYLSRQFLFLVSDSTLVYLTKKNNSSSTNMNGKSLVVLIAVGIVLLGSVCEAENDMYSDLPPPPSKPDRFTTREQLREYLVSCVDFSSKLSIRFQYLTLNV